MSTQSAERCVQTGLGPMGADPQAFNSSTLGTTPVKAVAAVATSTIRRCKVKNLSSSAFVAWTTVNTGGTTSITASGTGTGTDGPILAPGEFEYVNLLPQKDLYVVASAASTVVQVSFVDA